MAKEEFYSQVKMEYDNTPRYDMQMIMGDANVQMGQEEI